MSLETCCTCQITLLKLRQTNRAEREHGLGNRLPYETSGDASDRHGAVKAAPSAVAFRSRLSAGE